MCLTLVVGGLVRANGVATKFINDIVHAAIM